VPAPIQANFFSNLEEFRFVKVKHEALDPKDSYFRKLIAVEEVDYKATISEKVKETA
jgi:hypothetical protein